MAEKDPKVRVEVSKPTLKEIKKPKTNKQEN